jgi:hypothetical protein
MTTKTRNIVELQEIDPDITEISSLVRELNNTIVELNFILSRFTLSNLDGEIKSVTIPASGTLVVSHRLKTIPRHRIILKQVGGGLITDGNFTPNYIELNNSGVSDAIITIIILKE